MTVLQNKTYPTFASAIDNKIIVSADSYRLLTSIIRLMKNYFAFVVTE